MGEILEILGFAAVFYAIFYTISKLLLSTVSLVQIRRYTKKYPHIATQEDLYRHSKANRHQLPVISIISPAYNEALTIIDSTDSFLRQSYKFTEVIISCDGCTDNTLNILIEKYDLHPVEDNFKHSPTIKHKQVKTYFRSLSHPKLIVIDKINGGKADAQNAGIAIASGEIITIIDADSILESNALIHLSDIFERDSQTVGIGTPIGVVNDSNVGPDGVQDASFPKSFWAKIQVLEYLRSFLLGRMAMQKFRGLMLVSGAFGVYQKWIIEAVGGYSTGSLAEDMDIDCKIWRFIDHNNLSFTLKYVPEVFCWSQVPDDFNTLRTQRDRWARGLTETIWINKNLFLNLNYKVLGIISYPYYVAFEWLTPFIEIFGLAFLIFGSIFGIVDFDLLLGIFIAYYTIGLLLNGVTIGTEYFTGGHYKSRAALKKIIVVALIEPLFYHWINSMIYIQGNLNLIIKPKGSWGKMKRKKIKESIPAFMKKKKPAVIGEP